MLRRVVNAFLAVALAVVATSCRVDLVVEVEMAENGTGIITLTATADADVVEQAPGLAQDLRFDDLKTAGWTIDGPSVTDDGGITAVITHTFATPAQAGTLLSSLNGGFGPFQRLQLSRAEDGDVVTFALGGVGRVDSGIAAFTDPALLQAVGATPYVEEIADAGLSPTEAVGITFSVTLPGSVEETTATSETGALSWVIPLDGTNVELAATSRLSLGEDAVWSTVATVFLVALLVWLAGASALIAFVVRARRRRLRHRSQLPPPRVTPSA